MSILMALGEEAEMELDVETLAIEEIDCDGGLTRLWQILDATYGELESKLLDDAGEEMLRCRRSHNEDMEPYITRLKKTRARLLQVDKEMSVSDIFSHGTC